MDGWMDRWMDGWMEKQSDPISTQPEVLPMVTGGSGTTGHNQVSRGSLLHHHSPMKGIEARESSVVAKGAIFLPRRSPRPVVSGSEDSSPNPRFICFAGGRWTLRPVGGFCLRTTSSRRSSVGGSRARELGSGWTTLGGSEASGRNGAEDWAKLKVGSPPKDESR